MLKSKPLPDELIKFFKYDYSKNPVIFFEPKTNKKPSFEAGETYWVPEDYRLVNDLIQYRNDIYKMESPKWIEKTKMKKDFSRYNLEIINVSESKLQNVDKKHALRAGIAPKSLTWYFNEEKPVSFKKSDEIWRLKQYWEHLYPSHPWEDNPDIWLFEFNLIRVRPKYPNYLDKHWAEQIK